MKSVTIDQILAWEPCLAYPRDRIEELAAGRTEITAPEIAALDIPAEDRLWMLLHNEFLTDAQMHELACQFAEAALTKEREAGQEPDARSWAAIEAKRKWLRGEITDDEWAAAWYAAMDAAMDARYAAWYAAWYVAMDAARAEQLAMTLAMIDQAAS